MKVIVSGDKGVRRQEPVRTVEKHPGRQGSELRTARQRFFASA